MDKLRCFKWGTNLKASSTSGTIALSQPPSRSDFMTPSRLALGWLLSNGPRGALLETKLRLKDAHLVKIEIDHRLFQFGQAKLGCLDTITVGNVYDIDLRHCHPLGI